MFNRNTKFLSFSTILLFIFLVFTSCESENNVRIIKLGHGLDITHPVHKAMVFMAERLQEKSKGAMRLDIYPSQQLGSERECLELLQIGSLGMAKVSTATIENFVPSLKILGLPFLFRNKEHRYAVLEGEVGEELLDASLPQRLKGLTFYDAGSRNFYSKVPIRTPKDLEGLKMRVMESQSAINMVKALGGSPTPISWGELYTALQQGIVDGAENNLPSFYLSRHYEICKYFTMDEHTSVPDELIVGTLLWDKLTEQEQKWLKDAALESRTYEKKIWHDAEMEALKQIEVEGVEIIQIDKESFSEEVQPMYQAYQEDPKMKMLIEKIKAVN
ncbi:MAG: TRAP transporter substrate-binding protein [Leeuwenhoekiella sp.]